MLSRPLIWRSANNVVKLESMEAIKTFLPNFVDLKFETNF